MRQDLPVFAAGLDFLIDDYKFYNYAKGIYCLLSISACIITVAIFILRSSH
jgi:hypothetical protein